MIGRTLSHYRVVEKIGAGGMGEVYRAHDERLERDVALKVLPTGTLADEAARKRFRKEALALSKLNHPNIATVFDLDTQHGVDILEMELVEGVTLSDKLAVGPLREKEITRLGAQLAEGMAEAHERQVVHRDLKPANLRVTPDGRLKILDFGLAKLVRPEVASATAPTESFTETQGVAGTLPYMAPEQLRGESVDARTDIHALGAVLYEIATGQRAFPETQTGRLMDAILHTAPVTPTRFQPRLSGELERIILKCLEKEPEDRYQSAKEVEVDLRRLKRDTDSGRAAVAGAGGLRAATKKRWKVLAPAAALVAVLAGAASFFYFQRAQALTESDHILLADWVNHTGDPIFEGTLKTALAVKLEESPFLNIVSEQRVHETLELMDRTHEERITTTVGREICQRMNVKAMMTGEIAQLGSNYVVTLTAANCASGDTLAREQVQAGTKEDVLKALGHASSTMRRKLGESLASIEKLDTSLMRATTSSLEALKAFTLGREWTWKRQRKKAIPFYQRAIEFDPNFALAYRSLAVVYNNRRERNTARTHFTKAFELRERASEPERLKITAAYYARVTGEIERAIETLEVLRQTYPRDGRPWNNLGSFYEDTGQREKALENFREAVRRSPRPGGSVLTLNNLARTYRALGRYAEARATLEQMVAKGMETASVHRSLYTIAFLEGDTAAMRRHAEWVENHRGAVGMDVIRANEAVYYGRIQERQRRRRARAENVRQQGRVELAANYVADMARDEARFGDHRRARKLAEEALALPAAGQVTRLYAAYSFALTGDLKRAEELAAGLEKEHPKNLLLNRRDIPNLRARIALERGQPEAALELLRPAAPYEQTSSGLWAVHTRAQAYLKLGKGSEAAAEFQKILDNRGITPNAFYHALAHLGLGRAKVLTGDEAAARKHYQDFLALWKDADPAIPILLEAKAEYAKLQESAATTPVN